MPLKVTKQGSESPSSLVRRFIQRVRRSGILIEARKRQFFQRPLSKNLKKRLALRRIKLREEREKAKKMGRL